MEGGTQVGIEGRKFIQATGPRDARVAIIGEAGGRDEDREGWAFVGASGETLDTYLFKAGLPRHLCYVDNLVPYWTGEGNPDPTLQEVVDCWPVLLERLREVQPDYILCAGRLALEQFISGTTAAQYDINTLNGRPVQVDLSGEGLVAQWVVGFYHPAAGLHDPGFAGKCYYGVKRAVTFIHQEWEPWGFLSQIEQPPRYHLLDPQAFKELEIIVDRCDGILGCDTEGWLGDEWCATISPDDGEGYMLCRDSPALLHHFSTLIQKYDITLVLHNAMADLQVLANLGVKVGKWVDPMIRAFNLNVEPQGLKPLSFRHLNIVQPSWEQVVGPHQRAKHRRYLEEVRGALVTGAVDIPVEGRAHPIHKRLAAVINDKEEVDPIKKLEANLYNSRPDVKAIIEGVFGPPPRVQLEDVPMAELVPYACADADLARQIEVHVLRPMHERIGVGRCFYQDMAVVPILSRMREVGMRVDIPALVQVERELVAARDDAHARLCGLAEAAGVPNFNPGSGNDVATLLYDKMGLDTRRLTKGRTRKSTDEKAIDAIRCHLDPDDPKQFRCRNHHPWAHEVIELVKLVRELDKNLNTYITPTFEMVEGDGLVHPDWRHTVVVSGRIAHFLLTFPKHSVWGKKIRSCFRPTKPGYVYASYDLSQIELRVLASESGDPAMMECYLTGVDIHKRTAESLTLTRQHGKTVNFAIPYGTTAKGLQSTLFTMGLLLTEEEAQAILDGWFSTFHGVVGYFEEAVVETRRKGYVTDMWGRVRHLPGVWSTLSHVRAESERQACNMKIQGGAQGVEKEGMIYFWENGYPQLRDAGVDVEPVIQIHDDFVVQVPEEEVDMVTPLMMEAMAATQDRFRVPIECGVAVGETWGSIKE